MKLVFFGGIQGVGKTTLISWLENQFRGRIILLNPGELFRRYFYNKKIKTIEEIEELIVGKLEETTNNSTAVVHWHYAVRRPSKYIPQISFSRLKRIAESKRIEQVVLLLVEAPVDTIYKRRLKDQTIKKREFSQLTISEEVNAEEEFLTRHQALFSQILGSQKVTIFRLSNNDLHTARSTLYDFFRKLLG